MLRIKTFWHGLTTIARVVLVAAVLLFVVAVTSSYFSGKTAKTQARLSENQAEAAMESGTDAVETVGTQAEAETDRERDVAAAQKDVEDAETVSDAHAVGAEWLCANYNICGTK